MWSCSHKKSGFLFFFHGDSALGGFPQATNSSHLDNPLIYVLINHFSLSGLDNMSGMYGGSLRERIKIDFLFLILIKLVTKTYIYQSC